MLIPSEASAGLTAGCRREDPGNAQASVDLASVLNVRGELLRGAGRPDEARNAFAQALALAEAQVRKDPGFLQPRVLVAVALTGMGELEMSRRQFGSARKAFERAAEERKAIDAREAAWPGNRHALAALYSALGRVHASHAGGAADATACHWFAQAADLLTVLRDGRWSRCRRPRRSRPCSWRRHAADTART